MRQTSGFRYVEADGVQVLEMPYQGGDFAMTSSCLARGDGLPALEARLDAARSSGGWPRSRRTRVQVALPKATIDPAAPMSLGDALVALGMPLAFDRHLADFTGMAVPPTPADRLYIARVFHQAYVRIDEEGTEAAAATAVVMARAGAAAARAADRVPRGPPLPVLPARFALRGRALPGPRRRSARALTRQRIQSVFTFTNSRMPNVGQLAPVAGSLTPPNGRRGSERTSAFTKHEPASISAREALAARDVAA